MFLVRKLTRHDAGKLYAMKVLNKITVVQKRKTAEHTKTERVVSRTSKVNAQKTARAKSKEKQTKPFQWSGTIRTPFLAILFWGHYVLRDQKAQLIEK